MKNTSYLLLYLIVKNNAILSNFFLNEHFIQHFPNHNDLKGRGVKMSFTDTVVWICLLLKFRNVHSLDSLKVENDKETHTDCSTKVCCNQRYSVFTLSVCQVLTQKSLFLNRKTIWELNMATMVMKVENCCCSIVGYELPKRTHVRCSNLK